MFYFLLFFLYLFSFFFSLYCWLFSLTLLVGFSVEVANNGVEGYQKYQEQTYDFVLMDLQMPLMDGIKCTEHIRRFESEV
jgi:CheY-like chemotaxis protein